MIKRLNLCIWICIFTTTVYAQWTEKDSLKLKELLKEGGDIELNKNAIREIDFGSFIGTPKSTNDTPALEWDTKLPDSRVNTDNQPLTLRPYTPSTPFNYDPIYKVKFKVRTHTWRSDPFYELTRQSTVPGYMKRKIQVYTVDRDSGKVIEALNIRKSSTLGTYTTISGFGVGGLDFNALTTREFWDKSIGRRRARTLEVLKQYGDSTTVNINTPILEIIKE